MEKRMKWGNRERQKGQAQEGEGFPRELPSHNYVTTRCISLQKTARCPASTCLLPVVHTLGTNRGFLPEYTSLRPDQYASGCSPLRHTRNLVSW